MPTEPSEPSLAGVPDHLVLFDGDCGICNRTVRWIIAGDPAARFRFAPLQGPTAAALRRRHPEWPADLDSVVYVERVNGAERVHVRADAVFRICQASTGAGRRAIAWFRHLPRWASDLGYRLFARHRRRLSQRLGACPLPSPAERARFLP